MKIERLICQWNIYERGILEEIRIESIGCHRVLNVFVWYQIIFFNAKSGKFRAAHLKKMDTSMEKKQFSAQIDKLTPCHAAF